MAPLFTPADLNCLLHGLFLGICGIRDGVYEDENPSPSSRTILRTALYDNLQDCETLISRVSGTDDTRLMEMLVDAEQGKRSLDGGHVFALANTIKRPIIVFAARSLEGEFRETLSVPFRVSGIYLPLLWKPEDVTPDPLVLCYTHGHFSVLVGFIDPTIITTVSFPLSDEHLIPLPVHYMVPGQERVSLLNQYLRGYRVVSVKQEKGDVKVEICDQLHPQLLDGKELSEIHDEQYLNFRRKLHLAIVAHMDQPPASSD